MCENKYISTSFCIISTLTIIIFTVLIFLNMIFSVLTPDEFKTFKDVELTDYTKLINYEFLLDMDFGTDLIETSDYGTEETFEDICYLGNCDINNNKIETYNCSLACLNSLEICFNNENKCEKKECQTTPSWNKTNNSACNGFDRISKWRDTQIFKNIVKYDVNRYAHIIPKNGTCIAGYQKCGKINENEDYLCLIEDEKYGCPINDIIIKSDNQSLGPYYRSFQLGDKYIFISNNKTDNYLITNLAISLNETSKKNYEIIDKDNFSNVLIYNPYFLYNSSKNPELVYLNAVQFKLDYTYEDMLQYQEKYKERKIYTKEKIEELNLEVEKYKTALKGIGVEALAFHFFISFYFLFIYSGIYGCGNKCPCNCILCYDITPMKRVVHFYIAYSSQIVSSFLSFFFTIAKKITYNNILSMKYINEYRNSTSSSSRDKESNDYLSSSILFNNAQFIVLLISIILIVLYPILIKLTSPKNYYEYSEAKSNKNKTKNNTTKNNDNDISNELIPYLNNSNNNIGYDSTSNCISNNYSKPLIPAQAPVDNSQSLQPTNNQVNKCP